MDRRANGGCPSCCLTSERAGTTRAAIGALVLPATRALASRTCTSPDACNLYWNTRTMICKNHSRNGRVTRVALWLLFVATTQSVSTAAIIDIAPRPYGDQRMDVSIVVDGLEKCRISYNSGDEAPTKATRCRFDLSVPSQRISVVGEYSSGASVRGKPMVFKGERSFELIDFEPASRSLTRPGASFGQRVKDFMKAARAFASKHDLEDFHMEGGESVSIAEIEQAQERLGYPLPAQLVSLLSTVGEIRMRNHYMTAVETITDSYTTMRRMWETDEPHLSDSYAPDMLGFLRASTLLFTEVGDGLGGLLYRPPPSKSCGDNGTYIWTTQESGTWSLSKDAACPDFAAVFRWLIDRFVIYKLADELDENTGAVVNTPQPIPLESRDC